MNELQIFSNEEFGQIRTVLKDGEVWFVAKDLAERLGYKNTRDAINRHTSMDDRAGVVFHDGRQSRKFVCVNESGFYCLVFSSKMELALKFKYWVTSEVLPSIRKNGGYLLVKEGDTKLDLLERSNKLLQVTLEEKDETIQKYREKILVAKQQIEEKIKPAINILNQIYSSKDLIGFGTATKLLFNEDFNIGRNTFMDYLREKKVLLKNNSPSQNLMRRGYFATRYKKKGKDGEIVLVPVTLVTGKGVAYLKKFADKYVEEKLEK